jgi:hypothetical protein
MAIWIGSSVCLKILFFNATNKMSQFTEQDLCFVHMSSMSVDAAVPTQVLLPLTSLAAHLVVICMYTKLGSIRNFSSLHRSLKSLK